MDDLIQALEALLGLGQDAAEITVLQMSLRAAVTFPVTLAIVRLGKKRLMGGNTAFDVIVGVIIGSTVSRGLTGNAPLAPTLAAAAAIVAMHWAVSALALRGRGLGWLTKGEPVMLVSGGCLDPAALRRVHISEGDLEEALRSQGLVSLAQVEQARLERNGKISVIEAKSACHVLDVQVAKGVQTIRIEVTQG
jgi:uncharacterized membrane protein YcaP (DUF421 family)